MMKSTHSLAQWNPFARIRPCIVLTAVIVLLFLNVSLSGLFPSAGDAVLNHIPAAKHYFKVQRPSKEAASHVDQPAPVNWQRFAYVQYATNLPYLCNSVMLFARLNELGCRADRLLMYPQDWSFGNGTDEGALLQQAVEEYGVKLQPVEIQHRDWSDPTWTESYTKLLAVNQTQYDRVLSLDSDSIVLQCMDELFSMPSAPFAMPRAYWLWEDHPELSDQILLAEPNTNELDRILHAVDTADEHTFDMDIMNNLYLPHAVVLPHRKYDLLTGEFRTEHGQLSHAAYLGNDYESWNAWDALQEAKFLHFSDWPVPKPWLPLDQHILDSRGPQCVSETDCDDRDVWYTVYGDFKRRRREICGISDWGGEIQEARLPQFGSLAT